MAELKRIHWDHVTREQLNPLLSRQIITGDKAMMARVFLQKDCVVPPHSHEAEQLSYVVEGALLFRLETPEGTREELVRAGEVLVIPSKVVHTAVAIEDTLDIDIFSPIRYDWLDGSDTYLRK